MREPFDSEFFESKIMSLVSQEMQDFIWYMRLGFIATASRDGTPNVSPKGSLVPLDGNHVAFANIASPDTVRNLRENPRIEITTIDQIAQRGYRLSGTAEILDEGPIFDAVAGEIWEREGRNVPVHNVIRVHVQEASEVVSPAYWLNENLDQEELRRTWAGRYGYEIIEQGGAQAVKYSGML